MEYCGYMYQGQIDKKYRVEGEQIFDSPYKALSYVNQQWQRNSDLQIPRLLVVKKNSCGENEYAFFDFSNYNTCLEFINNKTEIIWSSIDDQKWNGDGKRMK